MRKIFIGTVIGICVVSLLVGGFFLFNDFIYREKQGDVISQKGYKDVTYTIEGNSILLTNGFAETEIDPGSASKVITRYFGNEARGDFNDDGKEDIAFLLTQTSGGSGTFYYVVAALKTDDGYIGTNAILLGDRIAPQTTESRNGEIIVNYADRRSDEPMVARPSIGVSKYFQVIDAALVEIRK